MSGFLFTGLLAASINLVSAQYEGWQSDQVNASICLWAQPRAAVIRDAVYLDGGKMYWSQGLSDGSYGPIEELGNPLGLMYTLNFSQAFETSDNVTALFDVKSKARGGEGNAANNDPPNAYDGAMLANDAQLTLFGGLVKKTDAFDPPREDDIMTYQEYSYGTERDSFQPGFLTDRLPENMTRYIAYGGAVSAPSENKAWYFGGMRAPDYGEIFERTADIDENPVNVSDTLITLDMETQRELEWSNDTLHDIKGRANPEVVWVPVGEQGILVVLGGVTYPDWVPPGRMSENEAQSEEESDEFMQTIDVYDIANDTWYQQPTEDGPSARTRGCAVVAAAQDRSSFNIYYYGGYAGVDPTVDMNDEVWVLSLPSFTWTRVSEGRSDYGRNGHKCFMPYPDQMMVIGGMTSLAGQSLTCLMGGLIQMYNLTSGEWMDGYDPENYHDYGVPSAVRSAIGGDATGGATLTTPSPSGWADDDLADVFDTPYETSKISTWYPYASAVESDRPIVDLDGDDEDDEDGDSGGGGGVPAWVAPTLGVVLGLVFITALLVAFCLWRRRKLLRQKGSSSGGSTDENGMRILSWIRGQPSEPKAPTVTTTDDLPSSNTDTAEVHTPGTPQAMVATGPVATGVGGAAGAYRYEAMDTAIAEMPDTSRPPELSATGLPGDNSERQHIANLSNNSNTTSPPNLSSAAGNPSSYLASVSGNGDSSNVSRGESPTHEESPTAGYNGASGYSGASTPATAGAAATVGSGTASSTNRSSNNTSVTASSPAATKPRVTSVISGISDREAGHLRQISEATVSSASDSEHRPASRTAGAAPRSAPAVTSAPASAPSAGNDDADGPGPGPGSGHAEPSSGDGREGRNTPDTTNTPSPLLSPEDLGPPTAGIFDDSDDYMTATATRAVVVSPMGNNPHANTINLGPNPNNGGGTVAGAGGAAAGTSSPLRRSVFRESQEDMSGDNER